MIAALASRISTLAWLNSAYDEFRCETIGAVANHSKKAVSMYRDMLAMFKRYSNGEGDNELLSHGASNIFAGTDTMAISLRSMFSYLCKNLRCNTRIINESDAMNSDGKFPEIVTFGENNQEPHERSHASAPSRRHAFWNGSFRKMEATIAGKWIPEGTMVGAGPWAVAGVKVYGEDIDAYRSEREYEADETAFEINGESFLPSPRECNG